MKKKIIAFVLTFAIAFGIAAPKSYADTLANTLAYSGGAFVGAGVTFGLCGVPDKETCWIWGGVGAGLGGAMIIIGIVIAANRGEPILFGSKKSNSNSPFQYVRFNTNGKETKLSVRFDY